MSHDSADHMLSAIPATEVMVQPDLLSAVRLTRKEKKIREQNTETDDALSFERSAI